MDILFIALNARYIHTAPSVRILNEVVKSHYNSLFLEKGIKDDDENLIKLINTHNPKIVGFSTYIWNIEKVITLSEKLKKINPNLIILLGGPEVSYESEVYVNYPFIDYIILGEAEEIIVPFIQAVINQNDVNLSGVVSKKHQVKTPLIVKDLSRVPSIINSYSDNDFKTKIIYYETSRGCPFNCSFCLSSLTTSVRAFDLDLVYQEISYLAKKAKIIKFLDRTLNYDKKRFLTFAKMLEKLKDTTFQFEVVLELFDEETLSYFENEVTKDQFRFEIGIQSSFDEVNKAIDRRQNKDKLFTNIKRLVKAKRVILHLDLIAGLPFETLDMFKQTFDQTFVLFGDELQLGFLKLLKGTKIKKQASLYHYQYNQQPPYEVISNDFITKDELDIIRLVEKALDVYYNQDRLKPLFVYLDKNRMITSFFDFLYPLGQELEKFKIIDVYDYYRIMIDYLKRINLINDELMDIVTFAYLDKYPIRPKRLFSVEIEEIELFEKIKKVHNKINQANKILYYRYQQGVLALVYQDEQVYYYHINTKNDECKLIKSNHIHHKRGQ